MDGPSTVGDCTRNCGGENGTKQQPDRKHSEQSVIAQHCATDRKDKEAQFL